MTPNQPQLSPEVQEVYAAAAHVWSISVTYIDSRRKERATTRARWAAWFTLQDLNGYTNSEIARLVGRERASVGAAFQIVTTLIAANGEFPRQLQELRALIECGRTATSPVEISARLGRLLASPACADIEPEITDLLIKLTKHLGHWRAGPLEGGAIAVALDRPQ